MRNLLLKLKFLLLLLLGVSAVGKVEPPTTYAGCGKCAPFYYNGQLYGYGCFNVSGAKHGCYATSTGCYFVQNLCGS